jgi:hypothetical protein
VPLCALVPPQPTFSADRSSSRSIGRLHLNLYVPRLQIEQGVVGRFREHRGQPLPSAALMTPMSRNFVAKPERLMAEHEIPLEQFRNGRRKNGGASAQVRQGRKRCRCSAPEKRSRMRRCATLIQKLLRWRDADPNCRPFRSSPSGRGFVPRLLQTPPRWVKDLHLQAADHARHITKSPGATARGLSVRDRYAIRTCRPFRTEPRL